MNSMNGYEIDGRRIRVNYAAGRGSGRGGSRRESRQEDGSNSGRFPSSRSFDDVRPDSSNRGFQNDSGFGTSSNVDNGGDRGWGAEAIKPESVSSRIAIFGFNNSICKIS